MVFNKDDNDDNNDGEDDDNNAEVPHAPEPFCSGNDGLSVDDDSDAGDDNSGGSSGGGGRGTAYSIIQVEVSRYCPARIDGLRLFYFLRVSH